VDWRTLIFANPANEVLGGECVDNGQLLVYNINGWGVASDITQVVKLDE